MPKVRLLTSFAGKLGDADSPPTGAVVDVSAAVAKGLCADGRAELVTGGRSKSEKGGRSKSEKAVKPDTGEKRG